MKNKKLIFTTLAALMTAAAIPASSAFAAADGYSSPVYPDNFIEELDMSADGLTDYAVNGDTYAFAVKTSIYILFINASGDRTLESKDIGTQITALDYADGELYYSITSGNAFTYPDIPESNKSVAHDFKQSLSKVDLPGCSYILDNETKLHHFDTTSNQLTTVGEGYSLMKEFNGVAYAVKNDIPYALNGADTIPLDLQYTDFSDADNISTGAVATKLKAAGYTVKTASLHSGSYYTQIDADGIGQKFKQIRTYKADGAISCLVLAEDGNLSVIVAGGNCYITKTDNLTAIAYAPPLNDWAVGPDNQSKAYIRENAGIYAVPFMSESTLIAKIEAPQAVEVTVTEKFTLDFIDASAVFYRIEFADENENTISGFVAAGFLDAYDYSADENTPTPSGNDSFSYETNVVTVILVLVVVGLVIIAIAYLTIVGTRPDKKERKKLKKQRKEEQENESDEGEEDDNGEE